MTIEQCNAMFQTFGYVCLSIFALVVVNYLISYTKDIFQEKINELKFKSIYLHKLLKSFLKIEIPAYALATFLICFLSYKNFPETKVKDGKTYFNNKVVIDCKTKKPILNKENKEEKVAFFSFIKSCKVS